MVGAGHTAETDLDPILFRKFRDCYEERYDKMRVVQFRYQGILIFYLIDYHSDSLCDLNEKNVPLSHG